MILEPARFDGGPPHCPAANLGAFTTEKALRKFFDSLCSVPEKVWLCRHCMRWHGYSRAKAPSGGSSGASRKDPIPARILKMIRETRFEPGE